MKTFKPQYKKQLKRMEDLAKANIALLSPIPVFAGGLLYILREIIEKEIGDITEDKVTTLSLEWLYGVSTRRIPDLYSIWTNKSGVGYKLILYEIEDRSLLTLDKIRDYAYWNTTLLDFDIVIRVILTDRYGLNWTVLNAAMLDEVYLDIPLCPKQLKRHEATIENVIKYTDRELGLMDFNQDKFYDDLDECNIILNA